MISTRAGFSTPMLPLRQLASSVSSTPASYRLPPTIRQLLGTSSPSEQTSITVSGWIKSIRRQKNATFAVVTDGSSAKGIQAVFVGDTGGDRTNGLTNGAAVRLTGKLVPSPGAGQEKELLIDLGKGRADARTNQTITDQVQVLGRCDPETYPIQKQALSTEYLRDNIHLRARTDSIAAMMRLRNTLGRNVTAFFEDQGFCYTHTPVLTANDAEGAGEAFRIAQITGEHPAAASERSSTGDTHTVQTPEKATEFFSRPTFLTVSHQLHLEALATGLSRVYALSPCFRAERSLTGRHLSEFWMLEAEWAFGGSRVEDVCRFVEGCLREVAGRFVGGSENSDIGVLWKDKDEKKRKALEDAFSGHRPWARISYTDAVEALKSHHNKSSPSTPISKFRYEPRWGLPLQSEHERWIAEVLIAGPVFITDYPSSLKPFYMRQNEDGVTATCFDLIVPFIGELVGGSAREERAEVLEKRMKVALGTSLEDYRWYLDLRKYGSAPHAGFGMGFERLVGWLGGIENIRECVPMPRWAGKMLL